MDKEEATYRPVVHDSDGDHDEHSIESHMLQIELIEHNRYHGICLNALRTAVQHADGEIDINTIDRDKILPFHKFRAMTPDEKARHIEEMRRAKHISHWIKTSGPIEPTEEN